MYHPEWIRASVTGAHNTKKILRDHGLSTVCEEAKCPNQGSCFSNGTATFMILGDVCTRNCSFCAVGSGIPLPPDPDEPERIVDAVLSLGLRFVVITSVTRDDLPDGGAGQFARTIKALRRKIRGVKIEVLTPDFRGNIDALRVVLDESPDVFNHNIETVPRLYPLVRPDADYSVSLNILRTAKRLYSGIKIKSGIMVGLGETEDELYDVMCDLRNAGCDFLTIGQYLQPRRDNLPVVEYIRPEAFERFRVRALEMGFKAVSSSPLTRSSMNADLLYDNASIKF
jgi:lipoic acid synthetase